MAGNVREWCWNANRYQRYLLGGLGGSSLHVHLKLAPLLDRSLTNGFAVRRIRRPGSVIDRSCNPASAAQVFKAALCGRRSRSANRQHDAADGRPSSPKTTA
jgi:hypothetical protein